MKSASPLLVEAAVARLDRDGLVMSQSPDDLIRVVARPARSGWDGTTESVDHATGFPSALHRSTVGPASGARSSPWRAGPGRCGQALEEAVGAARRPAACPWPAHPLDRRLPADLAARLLRLLDGGPELVRAQAARIGTAINPNDPATPALAVVVLGWLEAV